MRPLPHLSLLLRASCVRRGKGVRSSSYHPPLRNKGTFPLISLALWSRACSSSSMPSSCSLPARPAFSVMFLLEENSSKKIERTPSSRCYASIRPRRQSLETNALIKPINSLARIKINVRCEHKQQDHSGCHALRVRPMQCCCVRDGVPVACVSCGQVRRHMCESYGCRRRSNDTPTESCRRIIVQSNTTAF